MGVAMSANLFRGFTFVLGFLIAFRSQKAYSRWWEGGTLLQQLRGEWFNAFSSLLAFSNTAPHMADEVAKFQHHLVRLLSLLYANALKQVATKPTISFELIDLHGFDVESLEFMAQAHDACEVTLQWVQRLIVEANGREVIKIAPPLLARVYNQLGSGIVKLNNARKIRDFPIPFPLAQMVTIMIMINMGVTTFVCAVEADNPWLASIFSFVITLSFWGINTIAVELEQPFGDDDNDLPLIDMQSDLNQSLQDLLNPRATIPPAFSFDKEVHTQLTRTTITLKSHIEEIKTRPPLSQPTTT